MKITVLCSDIPYPPHHGGRIDMWNRLVAMKKYGVTLQLVLWYLPSEKISSEQLGILKTVAEEIIQIPRSHSLLDYLQSEYPPRMYSFFPLKRMNEDINRIVSFAPDWIWLDGWHGYLLAKHLKEKYHFPFVYRSHNVEHQYFAFIARSSSGIKKQILSYNAQRLQHAEYEMRNLADIVFDISEEDALFWENDTTNRKWNVLPPIYIPKNHSASPSQRTIDIGYIGNLWASNNREGLVWFVERVLPIIREKVSRKLRIVFAGASPHPSIQTLCQHSNIECIANPATVDELYSNTSVLINPVLNASGINIKMLDMLGSGNMIVTTDVVVRGIPHELRRYIRIAHSAEEFASHCIECIFNPVYSNNDDMRELLYKYYGEHRLNEAINVLNKSLAEK